MNNGKITATGANGDKNQSAQAAHAKLSGISAESVEKFYRLMVEEVTDYAILMLDIEGNILNWNRGAQIIKGYSEAEVKGHNFSIFYPTEDRQNNLPASLLQIAAQNGRAAHEGWRVRKNGEKFWGSVVITTLHGENGDIIGFSKLTRDLTERKKADERQQRYAIELEKKNENLRKSEERYHSMIAEVEDYAIILLDPDGNVMNWNKGAEKIKGYRESEIIGKNFREFYQAHDRESQLPESLLKIAAENKKATHEGWRMRKDRTLFWGSIVITALHDNDGNITGFSKVTRDLTQRKQSEDLIIVQNRHLEEFAYVASHDLQEPLRKISMFANLIERKINDVKQVREYLDKINGASARMGELIKAVLEYSRSADSAALKHPVDLNQVLDDFKTDFELLIAERNVKIMASDLPTVYGVPVQIHQLFANLISNAIKFNKNTPEIRIESQLREMNGQRFNIIKVRDNGNGIEPQYLDKIFQIFRRLDNSSPGTGIGLALCRRIVEAHGGQITVTSELASGSTFEIVLPAKD